MSIKYHELLSLGEASSSREEFDTLALDEAGSSVLLGIVPRLC